MYVETWRGVVHPAQCDFLGHMNVQYYFASVGDGMFTFSNEFGLGRSDIEKRQMCFVVVKAESEFKRELRAGDTIRLESTVEAYSSKRATFHHRMIRTEGELVVFEARFHAALLDLASRKAVDVPEDIQAHLERLMSGSGN